MLESCNPTHALALPYVENSDNGLELNGLHLQYGDPKLDGFWLTL